MPGWTAQAQLGGVSIGGSGPLLKTTGWVPAVELADMSPPTTLHESLDAAVFLEALACVANVSTTQPGIAVPLSMDSPCPRPLNLGGC